MPEKPRFKIWCERPMPPQYTSMLSPSAEVTAECDGIDGIIASARVRYDAKFFEKLPSLKVVSRTGIGYDNITVPDATARRIAICNAPDGPTISTAEHTMALLLAVTKKLKVAEGRLLRPGSADFFGAHDGIELAGKVLGIVGAGRIGRKVAQFAAAFSLRVVVYDPFAKVEGVESASSLDELLGMADILSLHLPLTKENHHMIDSQRLRRLKPGAFVINTARGGLIDESALAAALTEGHIQGAALDVFEKEPPPASHPLLGREDVIATPHIATATVAGKDRLWRTAIEQAMQVLRGERPAHLVNPEVWS